LIFQTPADLAPKTAGPAEPSYSPQYYHGLIYKPDCSQCPLQLERKVLPDGPIPARIAFIGEEPGSKEIEIGRGFVGPSGRLLWYLAAAAGISREHVWVTNSSLCAAPKQGIWLPSGAWISKVKTQSMAARCCRQRLVAELIYVTRGMRHPVLQPLGNWALWALTDIPNAHIYNYRGSRIDINLQALYQAIVEGRTRAPTRRIQTKDE